MPVLTSGGLEYLQNEVPGINIPTSALEYMREASGGEDERVRGLELARATLEFLRGLDVGGICIMPSLHGYDVVEDLLR
jgi:hypothetical protein